MRVLLLTAPMTQLNTPYPATAYLTGFLRSQSLEVIQADLSIELALELFSKEGLKKIQGKVGKKFKLYEAYLETIEPVIRFLQGKDPTLAYRIVQRGYLPEGPRFLQIENLQDAFGSLGMTDAAKYLASLYVDDLADIIRAEIDSRFELSRYAEKLSASAPSFTPLLEALESPQPTLVDEMLDDLTRDLLKKHAPDVIGITAPFPGNVYGAFRMARAVKQSNLDLPIIFGGGYVNTELRSLEDSRVFDFVDYICLDDGEKPLLCLLEYLQGKRSKKDLYRTFLRENGKVVFISNPKEHDIPHRATGTPTYDWLDLSSYLSLFEMLNPMHRLWSDGRWNKLTLAHGCYWKKCNFCDLSLDYIGRYDPASADLVIDRIEKLIAETGQTGFHFVDEAAPPALLRELAKRLIERKVNITWWGNIRFEKTFELELTTLLSRSGCVAVSGGLEVASNRLLKLMQKGVSVEQVARVTQSFAQAGILVHAYLMYGFPTQTLQETVDALEYVRQLFQMECIHSAFWHRFSATLHSPIGKNPEKFGIKILKKKYKGPIFSENDLPFEDPTGCDHERLGSGLKRALYNFMQGAGLDEDVRVWFDGLFVHKTPKTSVAKNFIKTALAQSQSQQSATHQWNLESDNPQHSRSSSHSLN